MNSKSYVKLQFDPAVAVDVGVEEAIMYSNIEFWCAKNAANRKHFYEGMNWTYNSMSAFSELFPFWREGQIRRILSNLESKGYIKSGNFNQHRYDQTKWYACPKLQMHLSKSTNGFVETSEPIPDSKPDSKRNAAAPRRVSSEDRIVEAIDPDTGEAVPARKPRERREGKNKVAIRIQKKFADMCAREIGVTPVLNTAGYLLVLRAMSKGGLTEQLIYDLLDEWISSGKPDEEAVQITRALSDSQVNAFKARNLIK